jgi:ATP-binding cassette, subfamily B, multidrug efflux pump
MQRNAKDILVAHLLSTVVNADSICAVTKGTVLEQGNHEELLARGGIYSGNHTADDDIDALLSGN